jgi:hypothetical protein
MNSLTGSAPRVPSPPDRRPDYCSRALALWPRLDLQRLARVRHDAHRVATLVSRRTTLPRAAILALLGAAPEAPSEIAPPGREN